MLLGTDTIVAITTPTGIGGVGIVRVSGDLTLFIAKKILHKTPKARYAHYGEFYAEDNKILDKGIALYFPAPNSFTGENVLELQAHGGTIVLQWLLDRIIDLGARLAEPGEFLKQAFINDKIDLFQAEAIADLIEASSEQAAQSALHSLQGQFSEEINNLVEQLIQLRSYVEASIDFPEEEIDFLTEGKVGKKLESILKQLNKILSTAQQGVLLREGMTVVILGRPNAGKSSLLNALSGKESAIITGIAGTTRDIIKEDIQIDGMPLHILDTAGLCESDNLVEKIGIERAWQELEKADHVLVVLPPEETIQLEDQAIIDKLPNDIEVTLIHNKIDLSHKKAFIDKQFKHTSIWISAKYNKGLDLLRQHLKSTMGYRNTSEGVFIARKRHIVALKQALSFIEMGKNQLDTSLAGELLAEDLFQAQKCLAEITGKISSDDLLGRIFTTFCVGK